MANGRGGAFHPADPRPAKTALRAHMRQVREVLCTPEAAAAVCARLVERVPLAAEVVAGYWPIGSELDIRPVLRHVITLGGTAVLPSSGPKGTPLAFRVWEPDGPMIVGRYGIAEPASEKPVATPTVVLVPLLAFDRRGYRLGYGAGYYDRTLAGLRRRGRVVAVGAGLSGQEVEAVPHDRHDQRLDWIVTEREALRIGVEGTE